VARKKKHLPEYDPLAGEGESSSSVLSDVHAPLVAEGELGVEGMVIAEYKLEQILPDYFQSRGGVLPREISVELHKQEIGPKEALAAWKKGADKDPAHERSLEALQQLADSIRANGLINAIHIAESDDVEGYVILAGERRYWAFWLLEDQHDGYERIPAILHADPLRFLQIAENEDVEPLSTVSRARQAALAYLELMGIRPPGAFLEEDSEYWDFYRQALQDPEELIGSTYRPRGLWDEMEERLGMTRPAILRLLKVIKLPEDALERADRWSLGHRQLLSILKAPSEYQEELVDLTIKHNLAGSSLTRLVKLAGQPDKAAYEKALKRLRGDKSEEAKTALRRPPMEKHTLRLISGIKGVEKESKGDFGHMARLIVGNEPESAEELAKALGKAAAAIRAEMRAREEE
jgi:ParB-like chromosome segregation protein Spo0J